MARPCGCVGECGCVYKAGPGIRVTGTGTSRDPGIISLATPLTGEACNAVMSCVAAKLGNGLTFSPTDSKIAVKISADGGNTVSFGTDGGVYASGSGSGGGGGFATVAGLVAQTTPVVGGTYGAGSSMWPEGTIEPYEEAVNLGLPLIHVPVRRSEEQLVWAINNRDVRFYDPDDDDPGTPPAPTNNTANSTEFISMALGKRQRFTPGGRPNGNTFNPWYADEQGYFGFQHRQAFGMATVADVLQTVNRRSVCYLQVKDLGQSANDTWIPLQTFVALDKVIRQQGAAQSVIVGAELPVGTGQFATDRQSIMDGLNIVKASGVAIAAHLPSVEMIDANTPASLVAAGFTWVMIQNAIADNTPAKVKPYKDAGLNVLLYNTQRQWQYNLAKDTTKFGAGGLKGVLSTDPLYCGGEAFSYTYRRNRSDWTVPTPDYGRHSPYSDQGFGGQIDTYRGYAGGNDAGVSDGSNRLFLDGDVKNPGDTPTDRPSGYFILLGEHCPIVNNAATSKPDNYDVDFSVSWASLISDKVRWAGMFVGVPEDRSIREWTQATTATKGYLFTLNQNGRFVFTRYDGVVGANPPYQYSTDWDSAWAPGVAANTEYRMKIRMRPDRIVVGPANQAEGGANTRTFNAATGSGERWRGPYLYIARHFFTDADSTTVRWTDVNVTYL